MTIRAHPDELDRMPILFRRWPQLEVYVINLFGRWFQLEVYVVNLIVVRWFNRRQLHLMCHTPSVEAVGEVLANLADGEGQASTKRAASKDETDSKPLLRGASS